MTDKINQHFENYQSKSVSYMDFLRLMLQCFYDNCEMFLALYNTDSSSLKKGVLQLIESYHLLDKSGSKKERSYIIEYYINGLFSVITMWLTEDQTKSVDDMAKLIHRLTYRSAKAAE